MEDEYELTVGLEVHAELNTKTKLLCSCKNAFGEPPNTCCCPVCAGLPGALPVLNYEAAYKAALLGLALGSRVQLCSEMARKNYFYPDLPKSYQISQGDYPICEGGKLTYFLPDGSERVAELERIHLEEDAGKLIYAKAEDGKDVLLADYNRCGVPLIELVTRPDFHSAQEATAFLETLRLVLLELGVSDCRMQEGSLRCDVNVSLSRSGSGMLGERVELKNLNSFSAAGRAIMFEQRRQLLVLTQGGRVERETRRWDDMAGKSILLRSKETQADYRFFAEPDLPPLVLDQARLDVLEKNLPELYPARQRRLRNDYALMPHQAAALAAQPQLAHFFERCVLCGAGAKNASDWLLGEVTSLLRRINAELGDTYLTPERLAELLRLVQEGRLSSSAAKILLEQLAMKPESCDELMEKLGLTQINDVDTLSFLVQQVVTEQSKAVDDFCRGKEAVLGYLVGCCMKKSAGRGNPAVFSKLLRKLLIKEE